MQLTPVSKNEYTTLVNVEDLNGSSFDIAMKTICNEINHTLTKALAEAKEKKIDIKEISIRWQMPEPHFVEQLPMRELFRQFRIHFFGTQQSETPPDLYPKQESQFIVNDTPARHDLDTLGE